MPGARTHDVITFIGALPVYVVAYSATNDHKAAALASIAFILGGTVFGPDLDIVSRQYTRWSFLRFIWTPYRMFFKHRSRFTHGLIFGSLFRVIYFLGILTIGIYAACLGIEMVSGVAAPSIESFTKSWTDIGMFVNKFLIRNALLIIFLGLWTGAASHTLTDVAISYIKTGRVGKTF